jgi:protein kinase-like protein
MSSVRPSPAVTQEGRIVGTFQYMSPEQLEGRDLDARTDIFSLGAVLYEMVTGKKAFAGKSQISVASAILEKDPEPISQVAPLTPPSLDHVIARCLAKERDERWQTASDDASKLRWIALSGRSSDSGAAEHQMEGKRSFVWAPWAICAVLLAALLFTFLVRREQTATEPSTVFLAEFLPDQKHFLYLAANVSAETEPDAIFVGALDSDQKTFLTKATANAEYIAPGYLLFYREKTLFGQAFDASRLALSGRPVALINDLVYLPPIKHAAFSGSSVGTLTRQWSFSITAGMVRPQRTSDRHRRR